MRRGLCLILALLMLPLAACRAGEEIPAEREESHAALPLAYAENFSADLYASGAVHLTAGEQELLLLPESAACPAGLEALPRLTIPTEKIYLASSSAADLFVQLDAMDALRCVGTKAEDWEPPELRRALEEEAVLYAGKYSAPDYELLLTEGCDLVIENTMILHSPAVRERLESLGLPVIVEYSSYEPHPLGRVEWIKFYGLLTGKLEEAESFFDRQLETFQTARQAESTGKKIAFFYITPNGAVVVRRKNDYVTRMIELAGGETALTDLPEEDNALSTVTIQMESFFTQARDADILIYNSTVSGGIRTIEDLLSLSPLLADFKAVREGNVWCTEQSMFQRSSAAAGMIADFRKVIGGEDTKLSYLYRVE